jgi:hypothetical protein
VSRAARLGEYRPSDTTEEAGMAAERSGPSGWVTFSAIMLVVAGIMNFFNGLFAITKDEYLTDQLLFANLSFWGWMFLLFGVLQALAGLLVMSGRQIGGLLGIGAAIVAASIWFLFLFAFPFGALIGITVNILVIYGLTVYADRRF